MIVYFDTSALVKLYVAEPGSAELAPLAAAAQALAVCRITWVEAHAALARRAREQPAAQDTLEAARQRLAEQWPDFVTLELTPALADLAARYADVFALRAYDAVQLAAAQQLRLGVSSDVFFACFDRRLSRAAATLGMGTLG